MTNHNPQTTERIATENMKETERLADIFFYGYGSQEQRRKSGIRLVAEALQSAADKAVLPEGWIAVPKVIKARSETETDARLSNYLIYRASPKIDGTTYVGHSISYKVELNGEVFDCVTTQGAHQYTNEPMFSLPCPILTEKAVAEKARREALELKLPDGWYLERMLLFPTGYLLSANTYDGKEVCQVQEQRSFEVGLNVLNDRIRALIAKPEES